MTARRDNLIDDLVADLRPVARPGRIDRTLLAWLALAGAYSTAVLAATGPWREGAFGNLVSSPSFALETLLAAAAVVSLAHATLRSAVPSAMGWAARLALPMVFMAAWIAVYVIGFWHPAHAVSMLGKRDHCLWLTMLFSLPSLALLLGATRLLLPLWPRTTAMFAGAASAAIPGALMQFACMYAPGHILTHHIAPIFVIAGVGALIGRLALVRRFKVPRSRGVSVH